ncbi:MAG: 2-isopropylmalate synthase [Candidatus Aenigmarchaeota archaeon]|nr:2-isopropylmalate synthase [Candidatus Aenigmarchaeota archaeon]
MSSEKRKIEVMDTTLRDGEQTPGVSFNAKEKLAIAKMLLEDLKVDRIEVASARVSESEKESITNLCNWAKKTNNLKKIEVLGFIDKGRSVDWIDDTGAKTINILAKGSLKHLTVQLKKTPDQHMKDIIETIDYAKEKGISSNIYLEDWSNGMKTDKDYIYLLLDNIKNKKTLKRIMLPDTLGILLPSEVKEFIEDLTKRYPDTHFDFHAHNDYGVATANSITAAEAGANGIHLTINSLGERAGNTSLCDFIIALRDLTKDLDTRIDETYLKPISDILSNFSGKKLPSNKPIVGDDVFTQTAGIHADGDKKGNLYTNKINPKRFGREREYALGKLSGMSSLDMNLKQLGITLSDNDKKQVFKKVIELGDKKRRITTSDLPFIIADVLETENTQKIKITDLDISISLDRKQNASFTLKYNKKTIKTSAIGNGGYDAFMNALKKVAKELDIKLPKLVDYEVTIPPGGKPDSLVETIIVWEKDSKTFKTIGVNSDQILAAIEATEKMLNLVL